MLLIQSDLKYSDDLFNYTRGRFVCNEEYEISQRQVLFNVNELARCAAEATGAKSCISIEKYPDGMYNKSMLLTIDNGSQVVAKFQIQMLAYLILPLQAKLRQWISYASS